jgi:diphthamide biosynthesis enzyme Dph1/Dph2-like protein
MKNMDIMFIDAKYKGSISLTSACLDHLKRFKSIALYASVQYSHNLDIIKKQLKKAGIKVITSKPERSSVESQLIGCDVYYKNLNLKKEPDAFLQISDGVFHANALLFAQKGLEKPKEVIVFDPIEQEFTIITQESVSQVLRKYKAALIRFLATDTIGVLISTKLGQEQYEASRLLEKKYLSKRFYFFIDNSINFSSLENFPFIKVWVNSACPRIALEDSITTPKPVINLNDALDAGELLSKKSILTQ